MEIPNTTSNDLVIFPKLQMIKQINFHNLVVYDTYVIILSEL